MLKKTILLSLISFCFVVNTIQSAEIPTNYISFKFSTKQSCESFETFMNEHKEELNCFSYYASFQPLLRSEYKIYSIHYFKENNDQLQKQLDIILEHLSNIEEFIRHFSYDNEIGL